jgi:uncharacterized protein (DUF2141 family)
MLDCLFGALLLFVLQSGTGNSQPAPATLEIRATGLRNSQGALRCLLFTEKNGFPDRPKKAYRKAQSNIVNRRASCRFENLPAGRYAISFIHDENGNRKLDTNFFGVPEEGYGMGNDARGSMGPPDFQDAVIEFDGKTTILQLATAY